MVWLKRDSVTFAHLEPGEVSQLARDAHHAPESNQDTAFVDLHPATGKAAKILDRVQKLIEQERLAPGSKLRPERALAVQLGVGRPALREAIKALCVLGILESRRGSGTFVKSLEPAWRLPPLYSGAGAVDFGMLDLLEVRKILEPRAAWLAATRASERQLLDIAGARQQLEMHDRDWKLVVKLDYELHSAVFRDARNPVLNLMHRFLMSHILASPAAKVHFVPDVESMRRQHSVIVEAILKRQADAAEKAMIDHLHSVGLDFIAEASR